MVCNTHRPERDRLHVPGRQRTGAVRRLHHEFRTQGRISDQFHRWQPYPAGSQQTRHHGMGREILEAVHADAPHRYVCQLHQSLGRGTDRPDCKCVVLALYIKRRTPRPEDRPARHVDDDRTELCADYQRRSGGSAAQQGLCHQR